MAQVRHGTRSALTGRLPPAYWGPELPSAAGRDQDDARAGRGRHRAGPRRQPLAEEDPDQDHRHDRVEAGERRCREPDRDEVACHHVQGVAARRRAGPRRRRGGSGKRERSSRPNATAAASLADVARLKTSAHSGSPSRAAASTSVPRAEAEGGQRGKDQRPTPHRRPPMRRSLRRGPSGARDAERAEPGRWTRPWQRRPRAGWPATPRRSGT